VRLFGQYTLAGRNIEADNIPAPLKHWRMWKVLIGLRQPEVYALDKVLSPPSSARIDSPVSRAASSKHYKTTCLH